MEFGPTYECPECEQQAHAMSQSKAGRRHVSDGAATLMRVCYLTANTLDPRLGIQQPEGEPVQPMPYWRRRMRD